jgi:hypothetical protein
MKAPKSENNYHLYRYEDEDEDEGEGQLACGGILLILSMHRLCL